jgi:signal transduction histidine kinase/CheY-like chemotaxis protein/CHASE3 domain sensor protein
MKLRTQILVANGIVVLLFIVSGWLVYERVSAMREAALSVRMNDEAMQAAFRVKVEMLNMETGSRGYLLTGNEIYLEAFHAGKERIDEALDQAEENVSDSPGQIYQLEQVRALSREWLDNVGRKQNEIRRRMTEGRETIDSFEQVAASVEGKIFFDRIRAALADLRSEFERARGGDLDPAVGQMLNSLELDLVNQETGLRGFLLTGKEESLEPFNQHAALFDEHLVRFQTWIAQNGNDERLRQGLERVVESSDDWREQILDPQKDARRRVNEIEITQADLELFLEAGEGKRLMDQIRDYLDKVITEEEEQLTYSTQESQERARQVMALILFSVPIAAFTGVLATVFISRRVLKTVGGEPREIAEFGRRIASGKFDRVLEDTDCSRDSIHQSLRMIADSFTLVVEQAKDVASGNFDRPVELRSPEDELGLALQQMALSLAEKTRLNEREDWLKTGQSQLDSRIRGDLDRKELLGNVLSFLASYLDAQVAVFYIWQDDGYKLVRSYGLKESRDLVPFFKEGEGLVGQAALEQKTIHVKGVPEGHVNAQVTSGTGDSGPRSILIVPFVHDEQVLGVLELGSVGDFDEEALELIERSHSSIAITLFVLFARERTQLLVEELENQAVELETQREDLQQSNVALEEHAEALKESQAELESQREELMVNNEQLDQRGRELDKKNAELEAARKTLEEKAEALEVSGQYKSQFLSNMSHELRTPLNSLLLLSESLVKNKKGNLDDKQIEYAQTIHDSGQELLNLINDILDLSKIESGTVELEVEPYSLEEISQYVLSRFEHVAESKGVELAIRRDKDLPASIHVDKLKLQQVMKNLLSNALKFTEKGGVTFEMYRPTANDFLREHALYAEACIALSVKDTGIGIEETHRKTVFDAFRQADGRSNRQYGGTGLGLTISKELVEYMGGKIELRSEVGEGSTFTVYLPLERPGGAQEVPAGEAKNAVPAAPEKAIEGADLVASVSASAGSAVDDDRDQIESNDRVLLIIEDDLPFASIAAEIAREHDFKVIISPDGLEGLELAKQYVPSAIILDIGLPGIDGWKVVDELKRSSRTRHIPINCMSALDKTSKTLGLGLMDFQSKPVGHDQLEAVFTKIDQFLDKSVKHLLLVEDDEDIGTLMVEMVSENDVETIWVKTGEEALKRLDAGDVDCVILDLGLGDISGFDVLKQINKHGEDRSIAVIVFTGRNLSVEEERLLKKMADSIIIKSVNAMDRLLDEVSLFLHRVVEKMPEDKQRTIAMSSEEVLSGKVALIVDDDAKNVYAISNLLEESGVTCVPAYDGMEALDKLKEGDGKVDIILTDVMMPEMDGYELIQHIRSLTQFKNIPIIAITAKAMKGDRDKSLEVGANDYLPKPVDSSKLVSLMRVWLS